MFAFRVRSSPFALRSHINQNSVARRRNSTWDYAKGVADNASDEVAYGQLESNGIVDAVYFILCYADINFGNSDV